MQIRQLVLTEAPAAPGSLEALAAIKPHLVFVFGSPGILCRPAFASGLADALPGARLVGCSTAGEISDSGVGMGTAVVTAVHFAEPSFRVIQARLPDMERSAQTGRELGQALRESDLNAVLVYGQGVRINGSALIEGITEMIGSGIPITGGLAGDDGAFRRTYTLLDGEITSEHVVAVGFYGTTLQLAHGCFGGWEPFGPPRRITRAEGNVLYELDGAPALDLYKRYLGEYAKDLPASGLMYPFELLDDTRSDLGLIRTILGIDETTRSLTLAGDLERGSYLRLMHASTDTLVEGAESAARAARQMMSGSADGLTILVSCVGRRLVMGGRVDEEVEAVAEVYGTGSTITGFYSYGEISPYFAAPDCKLHNQTMTVTHLYEVA